MTSVKPALISRRAAASIGSMLAEIVRLLRHPGLTWGRRVVSILAAFALFNQRQAVAGRAATIVVIALVVLMMDWRPPSHPPSAWAAP